MKKVAVLGSTGSIGTQTLEVIRKNADKLQVVSLVAFSREDKLIEQVAEFAPDYYALISQKGPDCLIEAVKDADIAVVATKGITALNCVIYCLENGIDVALANKETLVCGGELVMSKVGKGKLYTIDSEHCAISQCIQSREGANVDKILLTASGGPFWNCSVEELSNVTPKQALAHPNWNMGSKITIDSATMFNKTLEVLEAHWLFGMSAEQISVLIHPQSIVHSMVEFEDGAIKAQLGTPDMHMPISYALMFPRRASRPQERFDFLANPTLTFAEPDRVKYPALDIAYDCMRRGGTASCVMNGSNEVAVAAFLAGKCRFTDITASIEYALEHASFVEHPTLKDYELSNEESRALAAEYLKLK